MSLITRLKSVLGLGDERPEDRGTAVSVEPEPNAETEREVKESPPPSETDADPSRWAEPAEAEAPATDEPSEAVDEGTDEAVAGEPVQSLSGIGPAYAAHLAEAGVETVEDLAAADPAALAEATGIGEGRVSNWVERARER